MNEIFQKFSYIVHRKNIKVHNSVVCLRGTLLCPQDFGVMILIFVFHHFLYLFHSLFFFWLLNYFFSFFHLKNFWNSQKCPVSQNIWCLIKTQLKNITQTIFQGGSPWATQIHNSVVCLRVHYCVPRILVWWFFFHHFLYLFHCFIFLLIT